MSKKKILLWALLAVGLTGAAVGYMIWNKPHKDVKDADALRVAATELYNRFSTDSAKARSLYTDKILEISGEISKLSVNLQNQQIILLKTPVTGAYVNCTMEEKAEGLKEGAPVLIKGICSGYMGGDADMGLPGDVFIVRG